MTADHPAPRGRLRWPWIVGAIAALALFALWQTRLSLLEWGIEAWADHAGYGPTDVEVVSADLSRLELRNVRIGAAPGASAAKVLARYTVDDLQHGRVREAEIDGLRFSAAWNGYLFTINGIGSFGPFTDPLDSEVDVNPAEPRGPPPPLPFSRLGLTNLDANITLPEGSLLLAGDLRFDREATGAIKISGSTQTTALMFGGTLRGIGLITGGYDADGRLHARAAVDTASYTAADRDLQGVSGSFELAEDRLGAQTVSGSLLYESATLGEMTLRPGRLEGDLSLPADVQAPMSLDVRLDHDGMAGPNMEVGAGAIALTAGGSAFGKLTAQVIFDSDRVTVAGQSAKSALLDADLELDRMVPQRIQARLIHRGLDIGGIAQDAGVVQARLVRRAHATQARLDWGWGLIEAAIDAHEDTLEQPADFRLDARLDMSRLRQIWPQSVEDLGVLRIGAEGRLAKPLDLKDGRMDMALAPGSRIALDRAKLANGAALVGPTAVFVGAEGGRLTFDASNTAWEYGIALAPSTAILQGPGRIGNVRMSLGGVTSEGSSHGPLSIAIRDSSVALPGLDVTLADLSGVFRLEDGAITASLEADDIHQTASAPFLAPLAVRASTRSADGEVFTFDARLTRPGTPIAITIDGRHNLASGSGKASLRTGLIAFRPGQLQPEEVFPGVAGLASRFEGKVALDGDYRWTDARIDASHRVTFDHLNFDLRDGRVNALDGTVRIDGLTRPTTPPHQRLTAVMLTPKLSATPIEIVFQLHNASRMTVERFAVDVAGGRLQTVGVSLDLDDAIAASRHLAFAIDVQKIDLTEVFRLVGVDGLDGTGRISGRIPVEISGPRMTVSNGRLHSEGPGRLGYSGTELADTLGAREDVVGMAMDALADFRYESLDLELDKRPAGEGEILLHMVGANPDTLAGHPFKFNIRFTSDFNRLAGFVLMGTDVAGTLLRWATGRPSAR